MLPFVLPLLPLLVPIVWIGFASVRKMAPTSFESVGIKGFVSAYLTVIAFICLRAAVGSTGFINGLLVELFVSLPYVAWVVLPTAICFRPFGKFGLFASLVVSVCVAALCSYLNQYFSVYDAQLAISRGNSLIQSVVVYAVAITASVHAAVYFASRSVTIEQ
jgi:hypothetical protein